MSMCLWIFRTRCVSVTSLGEVNGVKVEEATPSRGNGMVYTRYEAEHMDLQRRTQAVEGRIPSASGSARYGTDWCRQVGSPAISMTYRRYEVISKRNLHFLRERQTSEYLEREPRVANPEKSHVFKVGSE
jgi:hypothetical protein